MNLEIREFSNAITKFIDKSPLPVEIKRLCVGEIAAQLETAADAQIRLEILERDRQDTASDPAEPKQEEEKHESAENPSEDTMEKQNRTGIK